MQLPWAQVNPWLMSNKVPASSQQATSGHKPPQLLQLLSSTSNTTSLAETA
jgi:hypothetical protein